MTHMNGENIKTYTRNPYEDNWGWWFYDEAQYTHGPYESQMQALHELLKHINKLNSRPDILTRFFRWVMGR